MKENNFKVLALDFDGVLCDSVREAFQTSRKCWKKLFPKKSNIQSYQLLASRFYKLRPVIESGHDLIVLLGLLIDGVSEKNILDDFQSLAYKWRQKNGLGTDRLQHQIDHARDEAIENNLDEWLAYHRFYPGVSLALQKWLKSDKLIFILTTKHGQFAHVLLAKEGIAFPRENVLGYDTGKTKSDRLRDIFNETRIPYSQFCFVEDRLKTLIEVKSHDDLKDISLFLTDWGYNTLIQRDIVENDSRINLISSSEFTSI